MLVFFVQLSEVRLRFSARSEPFHSSAAVWKERRVLNTYIAIFI